MDKTWKLPRLISEGTWGLWVQSSTLPALRGAQTTVTQTESPPLDRRRFNGRIIPARADSCPWLPLRSRCTQLLSVLGNSLSWGVFLVRTQRQPRRGSRSDAEEGFGHLRKAMKPCRCGGGSLHSSRAGCAAPGCQN